MKVIDLWNKIANGEELPLKIKVKGHTYRKSNGQFWCDETEEYLIDNCTSIYYLNDEVEVIEEDKQIKKLEIVDNGSPNSYALLNEHGTKCGLTKHSKIMCDKINEIINKINKMEDK